MAIEDLEQNIEMEKNLLKEIVIFNSQLVNLENYTYEKKDIERKLLLRSLNSVLEQIRIVNNSIPAILESISPYRKLKEGKEKIEGLIKVSYVPKEEERVEVTIEEKEREKFVRELSLSQETLRRLRKGVKVKGKEEFFEFKKPSFYAKISNRFFLDFSTRFFNQGRLKRLNSYLRRANMPFLVTTYFSMILFSTLAALTAGILIYILLLFFAFTYAFPFVTVAETTLTSAFRNLLIIIALPLITFLALYYYPYAEGKSAEGKINQELPFVAIHMSAIAGSGIEPTQIFKIIALGEEYTNTKKEFRGIINQVNVYGYDLITALKNSARETSSKKMSELLNGVATTISSGGSLSEFLDKRAETLLFDYKLERERYTKSAETFMDIYISVVIAAPMIMTLLLVLIAISGIGIGMSLSQLTLIIILIVSLINILFLVFLHLSQPSF